MTGQLIRVLVVGEETPAIEAIRARLDTKAFDILTTTSFAGAEEIIATGSVDAVIAPTELAHQLTARVDVSVRKLAVRKTGRTILLNLEEIIFAAARNKSTYIHTFDAQYIIDMSLDHLEERLAEHSFLRAHRSYLVNLDKVREIKHEEKGYVVTVEDSTLTRIPVSRRQTKAFKHAVGI